MGTSATLSVCPHCGWYEHSTYGGMKCDPKAGAAVDKLFAELASVPSTRLGYGGHSFAFQFNDGMSVQFAIGDGARGKRPYQFRNLHLLGSYDQAAVADLVRVLAAWRERRATKAGR